MSERLHEALGVALCVDESRKLHDGLKVSEKLWLGEWDTDGVKDWVDVGLPDVLRV